MFLRPIFFAEHFPDDNVCRYDYNLKFFTFPDSNLNIFTYKWPCHGSKLLSEAQRPP